MPPAASAIVTFLRRPPVKSSTDKITVNAPNGRTPIDKNSAIDDTLRIPSSIMKEPWHEHKNPEAKSN